MTSDEHKNLKYYNFAKIFDSNYSRSSSDVEASRDQYSDSAVFFGIIKGGLFPELFTSNVEISYHRDNFKEQFYSRTLKDRADTYTA